MKGIAFSIITAVILGTGATLAKYTLNEINPIFLAFLDLFIGFVLISPFTLLKRKTLLPTKPSKKELTLLFELAILGTAVPLILILYGLKLTTSIKGAFFIQLQSIFGIIFARALLKEKLQKKQIYGIFLIAIGSFLIVLRDAQLALGFTVVEGLLGDFLVILGAICLGYSYIVAKKLALKIKAELVVSFRLLFGGLFIFPLIAFLFLAGVPLVSFSSTYLPLVTVFYIITNFCIAYITMQIALEILPAWMVAAIIQTMPLFAVIASLLILEETITSLTIIGAILLLLGGFLFLSASQKPDSIS